MSDKDVDEMTHFGQYIDRRRFLSAVGSASVAGLAGCTGTGDSGETESTTAGTTTASSTTEEGSESGSAAAAPIDADFTSQLPITDPNLNYNEFNFAAYSWDLTDVLMDPLAQWNPRTDEWQPVLAESWEVGDKTLTMKIADGYHWHTTGEALTAEDAAKSLWLEIQMGWSVSEYATDARAEGEKTVVLDLRNDLNESVLEHELLGGTWINKPPHLYGEWISKFENASSEDEKTSIQEELSGWMIEEPFGYGPLKVTDTSEQRMTLEPFDGHPQADAMNFETYTIEYIGGGNNKIWQSMRANNVDAVPGVFAPKHVVDALPDEWLMTLHPDNGGFGVAFNHDHPDLKKRKVRQAIAHVVDRKTVAGNSGEIVKKPVEIVNGLTMNQTNEWFGDSKDSFESYEPNQEKAASLLREAGYEKKGGTWTGPNGPLKLNFVTVAGWADWVTAAQTINGQLRSFGIQSELNTVEEGTYFDQTWPSGDWDLGSVSWGGGPYPLFAFQGRLNEEGRNEINYPAEVTVPKRDGSGTTTVNIPELLGTINQNASKEKEGFATLAHLWNEDVPILTVQVKQSQSFITTDAWKIPPKDAPVMAYDPPATFLPKFGKLQAKTK